TNHATALLIAFIEIPSGRQDTSVFRTHTPRQSRPMHAERWRVTNRARRIEAMPMANEESRVLHWARFYDLGTSLIGGRVRALPGRMIDRAAIAPGERVLDVGCGPGRLTLAAAGAAGSGETLGIDPSPEMIALARRKASGAGSAATFRVAGIEAIPVPDDHFDVVLASLMLHHLPAELQG